jgi:hypothetical protein
VNVLALLGNVVLFPWAQTAPLDSGT